MEELIQLPKHIKQQQQRANQLALNSHQIPFYHPLPSHQTPKQPMPDKQLPPIPHHLTKTLKQSIPLDSSKPHTPKPKIPLPLTPFLKKYPYPPDLQKIA
ncbi:type I restriction enzyme endonuclease domain-containing protein, partial [Staphylococcus epidermidis]|uniref:type I restriction enzyme endonuclease domain-containing protein n=1 Tax=Staphylococcus epidermidis TaxID=1282 RepID=UPI0037D9E56F